MADPLRIALIMQGGRNWLGGVEYIKNIILALDGLPTEFRSTFRVHLISREDIDADYLGQIQPHVDDVYYEQTHIKKSIGTNRIWRKMRKLFHIEGDSRFQLFLDTQNFDFVYPYVDNSSKRKSYRSAAWIYDFQHRYLPQLFSQKELEERDKVFAHIAKYADIVVMDSKDTKDDFCKFFPESCAKARVLSYKICYPSSVFEENPQKTQQKYHIPDKFFVMTAQFWQHKNHMLVLDALKLLSDNAIYPIVVCTGHMYDYRQPEHSDKILQAIHAFGLAKQVFLLGLIPKLEQIQLMRCALAVIQPSLFEGCNIVLEEARSLGKAMILSDLPVNLERSPPHSVFFERTSSKRLAEILAEWWQRLSPGPDLEMERVAREAALEAVRDFGFHFLRIARGEIEIG